ncbi:MAG TPA: hypothetical protein VG941_01895 [Candidatus Paceibacterota bacterium]|nr:hypothetical protein [Candidatus Paceibacterota bacterium]
MAFPFLDLSAIPFLAILLILGALIYWVPSFFLVYHLTRFGIGIRPRIIALVFLVGAVILFGLLIAFAARIDLSYAFSRLFQAL